MTPVSDGVSQDQGVVDSQGTWAVLVFAFGKAVEEPIAYKIRLGHGMPGYNQG